MNFERKKMNQEIINKISENLNITSQQVQAVLTLLDQDNTLPFIARYRKEKTGGLNEDQIREIEKYYQYQINLLKRKEDVIRLIKEKGMLTDKLESDIMEVQQLSEVEDLYRPYREKRKTKATQAKAKGLGPLAQWIEALTPGNLEKEATKYLNAEVLTVEEAIAGSIDIVAENIADDVRYRKFVKDILYKRGIIKTVKKKKAEDEKKVYEMYYDFSEKVNRIVSHRILAINRAEKEKIITVSIQADKEFCMEYIYRGITRNKHLSYGEYIMKAVHDSFQRLLFPAIEREIRRELTDRANEQALKVFSVNLENLLLQAPLKNKMVLGIDPAYRTGCKLAVVDPTGKVLHINKVFITIPKKNYDKETKLLLDIIAKYRIQIIAIGNGTASRETEAFIAQLIKDHHLAVEYAIISEAGASVYSASPLAKAEFPDYQVEERSAVSIARRLQDPLAELVKIEPKAISVGQYQHDIPEKELEEQLDFVVVKTVNNVGVDINTASPSLLKYVAGLNNAIAQQIVLYRNAHGSFKNRNEIRNVKKIGAKTFTQAIGFLRILDAKNPLDATAIHPENYLQTMSLLEEIHLSLDDIGTDLFVEKISAIDKEKVIKKLNIDQYTLDDIIESLIKPNRSPRDEYPTPVLKKDILHLEDLQPGMSLEGTVRNVVDFGAFIDIGLKNDGLVHISQMSKQKVRHPLDVVSIGDIVQVKVIDVDLEKKRVGLSMI